MEVQKIKPEPARYHAVNPEKLRSARFLERPNRFLVRCSLEGQDIEAFLPNPGRLWEILLPGTELLISKDGVREGRKTAYTVIAAKKKNNFILLHTHLTNDAAEFLLKVGKGPGLEGWRVAKREAVFGRSRFDFLLEKDGRRLILEVKSCSLFGERLAMFPDAPSDRGRKHVEELAGLAEEGVSGAVLFLVQSCQPDYFLPDFHTDPKFAHSLYGNKDKIRLIPVGVRWTDGMGISGAPRLLNIPWGVYEENSSCTGVSLVLGERGRGGFWVKAEDGEKHHAGLKVIPIRSGALEIGEIERNLASAADGEGAEDGRRVFYFNNPPLENPSLAAMVLYLRTDGLLDQGREGTYH